MDNKTAFLIMNLINLLYFIAGIGMTLVYQELIKKYRLKHGKR